MMPRYALLLILAVMGVIAGARAQTPPSDVQEGAQDFRACASCHSLAPDRNMTGPSLAGLWGRKAGTLKSFERYSPALRASDIVWDAKTLDAWLKAPSRFIPGNYMTFPGVADEQKRAELIAFLRAASPGELPAAAQASAPPRLADLKKLGPDKQVRAIRICRDSYFVTTADGHIAPFWEPNLRFETDSSDRGPRAGTPAILPAGMMGDRASVIF